jgi:hypothetical protein
MLQIFATGISITTGAASVGATIPLNSAGAVPRLIRITASTDDSCFRIGTGAQTAVTTDAVVQPGAPVIVATMGCTHIAAIQQTAAGIVQVSPVEDI